MSDTSRVTRTDNPYQLDCADLQWQTDNIPRAKTYEDIYFSGPEGLQESEHVFLQHNQLPQRWQQLATDSTGDTVFTIGETGFGTGLNFLAAWRLWRQWVPETRGRQLHFISTEKHPLRLTDLQRALSAWPQLSSLSRQLIDQYPIPLPGFHTLIFDDGRVYLHLLLGDATDSLEQLCAVHRPELMNLDNPWQVNAWFLDGFAPAKNPSLWNERLYRVIARLSAPGTTVATFTAVGEVRRGLAGHGFTMAKVRGFGRKRDMLCGEFRSPPNIHPARTRGIRVPWYHPGVSPRHAVRQVAVIGGGLAGTHTAFSLVRRNIRVTLIEASEQLANAASGNPQGMLYTKLSPRTGLLNQFTLGSYLYALRHYRQLNRVSDGNSVSFCGVLQLARHDKDRQLLEQLRATFQTLSELVTFVNAQQASELAGIPLTHPGWLFPGAGWAKPPTLCSQLTTAGDITVRLGRKVEQLVLDGDSRWQLLDAAGNTLASADAVVIANSHMARQFTQCRSLPLKIIRGQITRVPANDRSLGLRTVICHDGYLTPAIDGHHHLGATFDIDDSDTSVRRADHRRNLDSLSGAIPGVFQYDDCATLGGRAALRCASPDYLPLVGPVPVYARFLRDYETLRKNAHAPLDTPGTYYPGLYLNVAHGSRGLTSTPLCGELLAAIINREPVPLERALQQALNPARFIIRDLVHNKI